MRIIVSLLLAAAAGGLALAQSGCAAADDSAAKDLMTTYAKKVHAQLLPQAESLDEESVMASVSAIAAEVLVPQKEVLVSKGRSQLEQLSKLELGDRADWEVVLQAERLSDTIRMGFARHPASSQPDGGGFDEDALFLALFWNPVAAAHLGRRQCLGRAGGPEKLSQRYMVEFLAPPVVMVVDEDPGSPSIALETGPDLFLVHLKFNDGGYYLPEEFEWLRKKSQP